MPGYVKNAGKHCMNEPPEPPSMPGSSLMWFWGRWYAISNERRGPGYLFTAHRLVEGSWVKWFEVPHSHFSSGFGQTYNRIRRYLLEGEEPSALAADSELAQLHQHWRATGEHVMARDRGEVFDYYGLDQS